MSKLSDYLGITENELDALGITIDENTGMSGETIYEYYFEVPESVSEDIIEKTGWEPGGTVYVPLWIVDDSEADDPEVDEKEMDWVRRSSQSARFARLAYDLDRLTNILLENNFFIVDVNLKMVYSYAVTLLEAYLCESAKHLILSDRNAFKNAVHYFSDLENSEKFKLVEILNFDMESYVVRKRPTNPT